MKGDCCCTNLYSEAVPRATVQSGARARNTLVRLCVSRFGGHLHTGEECINGAGSEEVLEQGVFCNQSLIRIGPTVRHGTDGPPTFGIGSSRKLTKINHI